MARATRSSASKKKTAPSKDADPSGLDQTTLTRGQIRKLNALRKSLGDRIADKAFAAWLKSGAQEENSPADKSGQLIADTLAPLVQSGKIRIPRGGYLINRGRRRVVVTRPAT